MSPCVSWHVRPWFSGDQPPQAAVLLDGWRGRTDGPREPWRADQRHREDTDGGEVSRKVSTDDIEGIYIKESWTLKGIGENIWQNLI